MILPEEMRLLPAATVLVLASVAYLAVGAGAPQAAEDSDMSEYEKLVRRCRRDYKKRKSGADAKLKGTTRGILPGPRNTMGMQAPDGAVTLLDEDTGSSRWKREGGGEIGWAFRGGAAQVRPGSGDIITRKAYSDMRLHVEFSVSPGAGNSGVYIQQRYEVQVLNSHGDEPKKDGCGALYGYRAPNVNAARPPARWQFYDIVFRAPRWNEDGEKVENARITVVHNGKLVHYDVVLPDKTGHGRKESPEPRPLRLQDHGCPVMYRNIWLKELDL